MKLSSFVVLAPLFIAASAHAGTWSLTVVDESNKPLANAYVVASPSQVSSGMGDGDHYRTDAAGRVTGEIPAGSVYIDEARVFVFVPGHAPGGGVIKPGENRVTLKAPTTISGRVVDTAGQPIPGLKVRLVGFNPPTPLFQAGTATLENAVEFFLPSEDPVAPFSTHTDDQGRYRLDGLPKEGSAILAVDDIHWQWANTYLDLQTASVVPDIKTSPAGQVSGRLLKVDGSPLADTPITMISRNSFSFGHTDTEGRYLLGGMTSGEYELRVEEHGQTDNGVIPKIKAIVQAGIETKLPDTRQTEGAVFKIKLIPPASAGKAEPIEGGIFYLTSDSADYFDFVGPIKAKAGLLHARTRPGNYRLEIMKPPAGYRTPEDWRYTDMKLRGVMGQVTTGEIHLVKAFKIEGTTVDEKGKPLAGIQFYGKFETSQPSDAAGRFTIESSSPGESSFSAGPNWEIVKPLKLNAGRQPVIVILKKVKTVPLRGRVVDEEGAPVEDADVLVMWSGDGQDEGYYVPRNVRVKTGPDGFYNVPEMPAGQSVRVSVQKAAYGFLRGGGITSDRSLIGITGALVPNPNATYAAADVVLQSFATEVSGRVLDSQGKPAANALVAALAGGTGPNDDSGTMPQNIARTDAEGHFRLGQLPSGQVRIVAGKDAGFAVVVTRAAAAPDIVLKPLVPVARDLKTANDIVMQLTRDTPPGIFGGGAAYPALIARYDFGAAQAAIRAESPNGQPTPSQLRRYFGAFIRCNADEARQQITALLPQLESEPDDIGFSTFLWQVQKLLPNPEEKTIAGESEETSRLRAWLRRNFAVARTRLQQFGLDTSGQYEVAMQVAWLAAVAERLHDPSAQSLAATAIAVGLRSEQHQRRPETVSIAIGTLAMGSARLVDSGIGLVPADRRGAALARAVARLAKTDLPSARRLLDTIPQQEAPKGQGRSDESLEDSFASAAKAVLANMRAADAEAALQLARRVASRPASAQALALAARLQPKDQAAALFEEARLLAPSDRRVAAIALNYDLAIGEELLQKQENDRFESLAYKASNFTPGAISEYAFGLAGVQPGKAKVWLEWAWARQLQSALENGRGDFAPLAQAMAAVDLTRSLEMADSHSPAGPNRPYRAKARETIAAYLAAPLSVRSTFSSIRDVTDSEDIF